MEAPITRAIRAYHLFCPASRTTPVSRSRERKYSSSSLLHLPRPGKVYSSWSNQLKKKESEIQGGKLAFAHVFHGLARQFIIHSVPSALMSAFLQNKTSGGTVLIAPVRISLALHGACTETYASSETWRNCMVPPRRLVPHPHIAPIGESQAAARQRTGLPFPLFFHAGQALDSLSQPGQGHIHRRGVGRHVIQMVPGKMQLGQFLLGVRQAFYQ